MNGKKFVISVFAGMALVVGLIISFVELSDKLAWAEDIEQVRKETTETFQQLRADMKDDGRQRRLHDLMNQEMQLEVMRVEHKDDELLLRNLNKVIKAREKLEKEIGE